MPMEERVHQLEMQLALHKKDVSQLAEDCKKLASRDWVLIDVVQPIKDAVKGIEFSVMRMEENSTEVSTAFKELIKKEEEKKEEDRKSNTVSAKVIRWGAISAAVASIFALIKILELLVLSSLKLHGL